MLHCALTDQATFYFAIAFVGVSTKASLCSKPRFGQQYELISHDFIVNFSEEIFEDDMYAGHWCGYSIIGLGVRQDWD